MTPRSGRSGDGVDEGGVSARGRSGGGIGGWVIAHGVDVVEVARLARSVERHGERFLSRVFTAPERAYADASARRLEHLAARFAAKEAVFKALGTGWSGGIAWTDASVERDSMGKPGVRLAGVARERAASLGVESWSLSLSHAGGVAIASAIALRRSATIPGRPQ